MIANKEEVFKISTNVTITVTDAKTGEVVREVKDHNLVTTLGKNLVRDLLGKVAGVDGLNYMAIGTDNTTPTIADTTLGTEVHRNTFTDIIYTSGKANFRYYLDSSTANGNTLVEAGLFGDDATGTVDSGTLFAHVTHAGIAKTSSVAVTYSWDVTIS